LRHRRVAVVHWFRGYRHGIGDGFLFMRRHGEPIERLVGDRFVGAHVDLPLQRSD
jgi:hypothetical protein